MTYVLNVGCGRKDCPGGCGKCHNCGRVLPQRDMKWCPYCKAGDDDE